MLDKDLDKNNPLVNKGRRIMIWTKPDMVS